MPTPPPFVLRESSSSLSHPNICPFRPSARPGTQHAAKPKRGRERRARDSTLYAAQHSPLVAAADAIGEEMARSRRIRAEAAAAIIIIMKQPNPRQNGSGMTNARIVRKTINNEAVDEERRPACNLPSNMSDTGRSRLPPSLTGLG